MLIDSMKYYYFINILEGGRGKEWKEKGVRREEKKRKRKGNERKGREGKRKRKRNKRKE